MRAFDHFVLRDERRDDVGADLFEISQHPIGRRQRRRLCKQVLQSLSRAEVSARADRGGSDERTDDEPDVAPANSLARSWSA
jgi:hypothetical protein